MKKRSLILDIIGAVNEYKKDKINTDSFKQSLSTNTNTQGVLIDNQRLSTKKESKTKGDLMNDLINGIVNSTM